MSDRTKKISANEKLEKLIEQKTSENEALKKLLDELNKGYSNNNSKKKK